MTKYKQKIEILHKRVTRQSFFKIKIVVQMEYLCKQAKTVFDEVRARQLANYKRFYSNLQATMVSLVHLWSDNLTATASFDKTAFYKTTTENDFYFNSYFKNISQWYLKSQREIHTTVEIRKSRGNKLFPAWSD